MGWIGCVRCKKFRCHLMARTSVLIAPVQPILHRVSCRNETLPNAPKHYETQQNMIFGSNGVDRVRSLRKIPMRLRGKNFCIETLPNKPKYYETHQNMSLGSNGVGRVHSLRKIPKLNGTNLCINCTSSTCFATSFL